MQSDVCKAHLYKLHTAIRLEPLSVGLFLPRYSKNLCHSKNATDVDECLRLLEKFASISRLCIHVEPVVF